MKTTAKTLKILGMTFEVVRLSRHTVQAFANGEMCASAASVPKLKEVLEKKYTPVKESVRKKVKVTIKSVVIGLIVEGAEDEEIIHAVKKKFPNSKFKQASVSWYRHNLVKDDLISAKFAPKQSRLYKAYLQTQKTTGESTHE